MDVREAAVILGVTDPSDWPAVRRAYRSRIAAHHPDRTDDGSDLGVRIIEAYQVLDRARRATEAPTSQDQTRSEPAASWTSDSTDPPAHQVLDERDSVARVDRETISVRAPADEVFRLLHEAAHDIGVVTYIDRSGPILEVLCRFVDQPATSLVLTLQGRSTGTDIFCSSESIEARVGPATAAVVDLLQDALVARAAQLG